MSLAPFPDDYRASGILLHVTSLPSPYGIGDLGPTAVAWIDRLEDAGQRWWQALPLGPTGYGDSPYQSLSSFAGNVLLISPDWLVQDGLVRASDCTGHSFPATVVDFDAVRQFGYGLLQTAWRSSGSPGAAADLRPAFEQFCHDAHWLDDYALFRAVKARYGEASYSEWPSELVRRTPAALERVRRELASDVEWVRFAQFLLFRQGSRLRAHARAKGVRLIGHLPFFVAADSSDVWVHPSCPCSTQSIGHASSPAFRPTISARTDSCGATRLTNATRFGRAGIAGGLTVRARCSRPSTNCLDYSEGSPRRGTYPPRRRRRSRERVPGPGAGLFGAVAKALGTLPFPHRGSLDHHAGCERAP